MSKYTSFLLLLLLPFLVMACRQEVIMNHPRNIHGVDGFQRTFRDANDIQLKAAMALGVTPLEDANQAGSRRGLRRITSCDAYRVDSLANSLPLLTGPAGRLLEDIGEDFRDSLRSKGLNPYRVVVTSLLRTREDIRRLRRTNRNSLTNSAHCYGTTFDVSWKRFEMAGKQSRVYEAVSGDTLKLVLAEVLRDLRKSGRCYVRYEVRQGCFHITSRA